MFPFDEQEKLKEKKPALAEALIQTLQAMHKAGCITLIDIVEGRFRILDFLFNLVVFCLKGYTVNSLVTSFKESLSLAFFFVYTPNCRGLALHCLVLFVVKFISSQTEDYHNIHLASLTADVRAKDFWCYFPFRFCILCKTCKTRSIFSCRYLFSC